MKPQGSTVARDASAMRARSYILAIIACVLMILQFNSCQEPVAPYPPGFSGGSTGTVSGRVTTILGDPLIGVIVTSGAATTSTDSRGEYVLTGVPAATRVVVAFTSDGYVSNQKITSVRAGRTSFLNVSVSPIGATRSFSAAAGITLSVQGAKVTIPANAIVDAKGAPYQGSVRINATFFDPTVERFTDCFPGEFKGVRTDKSEVLLESYGFMTVDLLNGTEKLQLAPGKQATLTMPLSAEMLSTAPATIPLWYFDEKSATWIEEGSATLVGSNYVGTVRHFTPWNCDWIWSGNQWSYLEGRVVDQHGDPLSGAVVRCYRGFGALFQATTNDSGRYRIAVIPSSGAVLTAYYFRYASPETPIFTSPDPGLTATRPDLVITVDTIDACSIIGGMIDNGGFKVRSCFIQLKDGTGKLVDQVMATSGNFRFFVQNGRSFRLEFHHGTQDSTTLASIDVSTPQTGNEVNIGTLKLNIGGATLTGRVVDAQGAAFPWVKIYTSERAVPPDNPAKDVYSDSLGRFKLWLRPNLSYITNLGDSGRYKVVTLTTGPLGSTRDVGDITFP